MVQFLSSTLENIGFSRILIVIILWNLIVFFVYGIDKLKAKKDAWRISEKALLLSAFFLGGIGAFAGMKVFRHKTQHTSFKILIPIFAILTLVALCYGYYLYSRSF